MKKELLIALAASTMLFASSASAQAVPEKAKPTGGETVDYSVFESIRTQDQAEKMSDAEIERSFKRGGWNVSAKQKYHFDMDGNPIDPNATANEFVDAQYLTVTVWENYNDRYRDQWAIYADWEWTCGWSCEDYPGSYDVVSINWQSSYLDFRSYATDTTNVWLADADKMNSGTMIWNTRDNVDGSTYIGLRQKTYPDGRTANSSVKYTHTYDATESSTTQGGTAGISWGTSGGGLNVGYSYSVTTTTKEEQWPRSAAGTFVLN